MPNEHIHVYWGRFLRFAGLFFLCLLIVHLLLRYIAGFGNPVLVQSDPYCNYIFKPNQNIFKNLCRVRINKYGMRSDVDPDAPPDRPRVLLLGDSIAYGTTRVTQDKIFASLLGRDLHAEVLNASASGWAITNELGYLKSRGLFSSRIVIVVLNTEDLGQPINGIAALSGPVYTSKPFSAESDLVNQIKARHTVDGGVKTRAINPEIMAQNLAALEEMRKIATANHADFGIVYIPFRKDLDNHNESAQILAKWAGDRNVPFLDLTEAEKQRSSKEITLDGAHLNVAGNQLVAAQMSPWVRKMLASPRVSPDSTTQYISN